MHLDLSVVIPTFRRHEKLARALDSLGHQERPPRFEVVVVHNPGDDAAAVDEAIGDRRYPITHLAAERPGASAARNAGWRAAEAELIVFIGDDILAGPVLVAQHLEWHRRDPADEAGVLGDVRWAREIRVTPFMRWLERGQQFDFGAIQGIEAGPGRLYTANVSLKRRILERVGGFDEDLPFLYEDIDLGYRLSRLGFRLLYNHRAAAEHLHAITIEDWRERMVIAARAERRFVTKHPELSPHLYAEMRKAVAAPPARGRSARLVRFVPPWVPGLGKLVWASAERVWLQDLAPAFLSAWADAGADSLTATNSRTACR